ncbi:hypothetical protein TNCV_2059881 [Trichonephila clavipes]|nr:hypothetical protein TNCV_2059881 [Trichonephila clavipes]
MESELKDKGIAVKKVAQLRRFATKAPLPLFMVEVKRSVGAEKIYELKNGNCLTVEVVSYHKCNKSFPRLRSHPQSHLKQPYLSANQRAPLPLQTLRVSLTAGVMEPLLTKSTADSCRLIGRTVALLST